MAYITTGQIAKTYGVSVRTVHRMIKAGELVEALRVPGDTGARLFDPDEVARTFDTRKTRVTAA